MKWTLISFLCIVAISNAVGQKNVLKNAVLGERPVNIALDEVNKSFTPPPQEFRNLKSGQTKKSEIIITYVDFPEEAKSAFEYAVSIYEQNISSSVPIMISATWEPLNVGILAKSGPSTFHKNFNSALIPNVYYPIALVEKLSGREWNDEKDADIICSFDSERNWYFATDGNTPETKYDLVTVVLHEIAHGLGISGFLKDENGVGKFNNAGNNPSAYDYYIYNSQNQRISDNSLFSSPSTQLHNQITSNELDFSCSTNCDQSKSKIYAPSSWRTGVSIYHLQNVSGSSGELMSPSISKGQAIHNPGESTIKILSEIGWGAISLKLQEINDFENSVAHLPIQTKFSNDVQIDNSSLQIIFSTDYFSTKDSVTLKFNNTNNLFEGNLPLDFHKGKVQYYFKSKTTDNKIITQPHQAPKNILSFKVGPDYYPPTLQHNPITLISCANSVIDVSAIANDNIGIHSVKVEYKINGVVQELIQLEVGTDDFFNGNLNLPSGLTSDDLIEYRIFAEDNSNRKNKKYLPANGYYNVGIFEPEMPVKSFSTDFNSFATNFTTAGFEITTPAGFSDKNLHTNHPYEKSNVDDKRHSLIAQLNLPVILEENGRMTFDEVVLVEPGEPGVNFTDKYFWDFVIVEGSKDNGKTWQPFIDGYDSGVVEEWESQFSSTLKSSTSSASGHENMFWENSINLTDNKFFSAGRYSSFPFPVSIRQICYRLGLGNR